MDGLEISPFIQSLPKIEIHVHIEGTLRPAIRWALAQRNNIPVVTKGVTYHTYEELLESYKVTYNHRPEQGGRKDVPTFLEAYFAGCDVLRTEEDFYDMSMDYLKRCSEMKVRWTEPFFDIQAHTRRGIPFESVLNGYLRAQRDGEREYGVKSKWIFCFLRDEPVEEGEKAYEQALSWADTPTGKGLFHAVGLASNAYKRPPMLFKGCFDRAKQDGLHITTHCDFGQTDTHEHIRQAIFDIGIERIDHGLDALDDEKLIQGLVERNIGLTLCPHAYHRRTKTEVLFPKLRQLLDRGVKFCINSDDPVYMHDVWVDGNIEKAYHYGGLSKKEMVGLVQNAVEMCWADQSVKDAILKELQEVDAR